MIKKGKLRAEKIEYKDGVGCCVWYPLINENDGEDQDEESGICFDFDGDDIDDMIELLKELKNLEPEIFKE